MIICEDSSYLCGFFLNILSVGQATMDTNKKYRNMNFLADVKERGLNLSFVKICLNNGYFLYTIDILCVSQTTNDINVHNVYIKVYFSATI